MMQPLDINRIYEMLDKILAQKSDQVLPDSLLRQSSDTSTLDAALAKAQGEFIVVGFNAANPFFKSRYAKLDAILSMALPILSKHGIFFTQLEHKMPNGNIWLYTQLRHTGQFIESRVFIRVDKEGIQEYGKALSYHKRYSAMAILGITTADDPDDDDGEELMAPHRQKETVYKEAMTKRYVSVETISQKQIAQLESLLAGRRALAEEMMKSLGIAELYQMAASDFDNTLGRLEAKIRINPVRTA